MGVTSQKPGDNFRRRPAADTLESLLQLGTGQVGDRPSTVAMWCAWRPYNAPTGFAQWGVVEGGVVLIEHAVEFADGGRVGTVLTKSDPNMLAARRPGVRTQVMDTQFVKVRGKAVRIGTSLIGAKIGGVEVEHEKPKSVVRAGEIDRPWIVGCLLRRHHACVVVVFARWVDPHGPARRPLVRKCLIEIGMRVLAS
ncbi:hypothetical protein R1CP_40230 (plasmid) [Rhodococcus opacus]|uniref:Uncharacterized protein n=1 Tax=Rhodococcus opacus TaxID=37919 RepID=A0A1B1KJ31_RHOOP|nr:hypothetical protein R1CP_40230 [Rhodococcus opacus]